MAALTLKLGQPHFRKEQLRAQVEHPDFVQQVEGIISCFVDALVYVRDGKTIMTLSGKQTNALPESHHDYLGEPIDDETLALHVTGQLSNKTR